GLRGAPSRDHRRPAQAERAAPEDGAQAGRPDLPRHRVARGRTPRLPGRTQGRHRRRVLARAERVQRRDLPRADPRGSQAVAGMSRWQRRARLVIAVFALTFLVVVAFALKRRTARVQPAAVVPTDAGAVVVSTGGQTKRFSSSREDVNVRYEQL